MVVACPELVEDEALKECLELVFSLGVGGRGALVVGLSSEVGRWSPVVEEDAAEGW